MREREAVESLADLAHERAVLIELEETRVAAARVDEHVPLGVGRDADAFAEVQVRRKLQEVRHRLERDLRYVLRLCLALRVARRGEEQPGHEDAGRHMTLH